MRITRRTLQLGLGLIWLLDGALQCQSFMFTKAFGRTIIAPTGVGQPGFVSHPVHFAATLVIAHPVLTNSVFAAVQLGIGLGLLWRRTVPIALAGSIVWGISVWYLGEGLGGLTTGETLLTGAPGGALLYAVVALLAFPDRDGESHIAPPSWAVPLWTALWAMGAGLQIAAGNATGASFAAMFRDAGTDAGGWIGRIDATIGHQNISTSYVAALTAVMILVAMWALIPGRARQWSVLAGTVIAVAAWTLVQGLGELTTGSATDPNTGPLIVLLALAVYGTRSAPWSEEAFARLSAPVPGPSPVAGIAVAGRPRRGRFTPSNSVSP